MRTIGGIGVGRSALLCKLKSIVLSEVAFLLALVDASHGVLCGMSAEKVGAWIFVVVVVVVVVGQLVVLACSKLALDARAWRCVSTGSRRGW